MLAPNHVVFGSSLVLIILAAFGVSLSLHWSIVLIAMIGSLMPDIDMPKSTVGRLLPFLSKPIERKFGHRTVTHSLIGWGIASIIGAVLLLGVPFLSKLLPKTPWAIWDIPAHLPIRWTVAFSIGYLSHLILDMLNPRGVQLFWPNMKRDVIISNPRFMIRAGSKTEIPLFMSLCVLLIVSLPVSKYGVMPSVRWLLATPEAVIEEFKASKTVTFVSFDGRWTQTKEPVSGLAEVIDAHDKELLVRLVENPSPQNGTGASTLPHNIVSSNLISPNSHLTSKLPNDIHYRNAQKESHSREGGNPSLFVLSNKADADIQVHSVRTIKTETPIKLQSFEFQYQTKEELLDQISENTLVSGVIRLPKGAVVQNITPNGSHQAVRQVKNTLQLTFATREQLQGLELDEVFTLSHQKKQAQLIKARKAILELKEQLRKLDRSANGLTALGREALMTPKEKQSLREKKQALFDRLQDKHLLIRELSLELQLMKPVFSGTVWLRG